MNGAHAHLVLNHIPVVGLAFALPLLAWGAARRNPALVRAGLVFLVALGVLAIPVYLTGEPAEGMIKGLPGVGFWYIDKHEDAAGAALAAVLVVGALAVAGLWLYRAKTVASWFAVSMLLACFIALGLMAWTANLGGKIRHSEIRGIGSALPAGEQEE